jgi:radical SAM protein with 4Fe4S-binding SPASM domain
MVDRARLDHTRTLLPGMTRNCIEPWEYIEFTPKGDVRPCCVRPAIGNLAKNTLSQILHGEAIKEIKRGLLTGKMDNICKHCRIAPPVEPRVLVERVAELMAAIALPPDFNPDKYYEANPDVARSKMSAEAHFLKWGRLEGRPLRPPTSGYRASS